MDKLKVIRSETHSYGQSEYTFDRPVTGADFLPQVFAGLDPKKTYKVVDGVFVEVAEPIPYAQIRASFDRTDR